MKEKAGIRIVGGMKSEAEHRRNGGEGGGGEQPRLQRREVQEEQRNMGKEV